MASRKRLLAVMGTRPEAIKLAPLILRARANPDAFEMLVVRTSQHQEMLDQVVDYFGIPILADLDIMRPDQDLVHVTNAALEGLHRVIGEVKPDIVIVQGDTATSFVGALAAFYQNTPVAHVEAGLRTYDNRQPFPEEAYRRLTSVLTDLHFAPTEAARINLLNEHVPAERIWVTGNTAIDALLLTLKKAGQRPGQARQQPQTLLLTTHRRENHGEPMRRICEAILTLLDRFPNLRVVCPLHLSPRVRDVIFPMLQPHPRVSLVEPLSYEPFVLAMNEAYIILSDSGGIQEEAPALGKPVLVLRNTTERPEAVDAGTARLVGTEVEAIVSACERLLTSRAYYRSMAHARNPFGDGHASERILAALAAWPAGVKQRARVASANGAPFHANGAPAPVVPPHSTHASRSAAHRRAASAESGSEATEAAQPSPAQS